MTSPPIPIWHPHIVHMMHSVSMVRCVVGFESLWNVTASEKRTLITQLYHFHNGSKIKLVLF